MSYISPASHADKTCDVIAEVKTTETVGPVLIHIITQKGKGYAPAESASDKMHGVGPYNPKDGKSISKPSSKPKVMYLCVRQCWFKLIVSIGKASVVMYYLACLDACSTASDASSVVTCFVAKARQHMCRTSKSHAYNVKYVSM